MERAACKCPKSLLLLFLLFFPLDVVLAQQVALPPAYAHNDYWHKHPFYDAHSKGFTHMEADIFLRGQRLLVAHTFPFLGKRRTLDSLYLAPLSRHLHSKQGQSPTAMDTLLLMIDIKSEGEKALQTLKRYLEEHRSLLSTYENGRFVRRQLTIVLTGHRPLPTLRTEATPYLFVDEHLPHVNHDTAFAAMYATASCKYSRLLQWKGKGPMPSEERARLIDLVEKAHLNGKKVRLWASPENETVWTELLRCGVDLINTDRLEDFHHFFTRTRTDLAAIHTQDE